MTTRRVPYRATSRGAKPEPTPMAATGRMRSPVNSVSQPRRICMYWVTRKMNPYKMKKAMVTEALAAANAGTSNKLTSIIGWRAAPLDGHEHGGGSGGSGGGGGGEAGQARGGQPAGASMTVDQGADGGRGDGQACQARAPSGGSLGLGD